MTGAINLIFSTSTSTGGGGGGTSDLTAVVEPTFVDGFRRGKGTVETSVVATCFVSGGVAPYTYAWTRVSGDTAIYPFSPGYFETKFGASLMTFDTQVDGLWKCVVTDSASATVDSNELSIQLYNSGDFYD